MGSPARFEHTLTATCRHWCWKNTVCDMRAKVFWRLERRTAPAHWIPSLFSAWKTIQVCTYRENELNETNSKKMPYLVFIVFSLGPLIEYTIDLRIYAVNIDLKKPQSPPLVVPALHKNVVLPGLKHSPKTHHLNPELRPQRKWSQLQCTDHSTALLFLDHVVMKTVILIIKVIDAIKVYVQSYKRESNTA